MKALYLCHFCLRPCLGFGLSLSLPPPEAASQARPPLALRCSWIARLRRALRCPDEGANTASTAACCSTDSLAFKPAMQPRTMSGCSCNNWARLLLVWRRNKLLPSQPSWLVIVDVVTARPRTGSSGAGDATAHCQRHKARHRPGPMPSSCFVHCRETAPSRI